MNNFDSVHFLVEQIESFDSLGSKSVQSIEDLEPLKSELVDQPSNRGRRGTRRGTQVPQIRERARSAIDRARQLRREEEELAKVAREDERRPPTPPEVPAVEQQLQVMDVPHYVGWRPALDVLSWQSWYDVKELLKTMKSFKRMNFSIVEQRQQMLTAFSNLDTDAPFSETERFPERRIFVCESKGDWSRKFQQLRTALNYKESAKERTTEKSTTNTDYGDTMLAFQNSITAIITQVAMSDVTWTRAGFEDDLRLQWVERNA